MKVKRLTFLLILVLAICCIVLIACKPDNTEQKVFKTVQFNLNGGQGEIASMQFEVGKAMADLPVAEYDSHVFVCWVDANGAEYTSSSVMPDVDLILTAKWKEDEVVFENVEFEYELLDDGYCVTGLKNKDNVVGDIVIPSTHLGKPVVAIGSSAFRYCKMTSVIVSSNVRSIGYTAFFECRFLTTITLPASLKKLENHAIYECNQLQRINYLGSLADWCAIEFQDDYSNPLRQAQNLYIDGNLVTDLVIPQGVEKIGAYAFYDYTKITSVVIPDTVTEVGANAFFMCMVKSATIPACAVGALCNSNYWLETLVITSGATSSGTSFCSSLTSVTICDGVTALGAVGGEKLQYNEYQNGYYLGNDTNPYYAFVRPANSQFSSFHKDTKLICSRAFSRSDISEITFPDGLISIGDSVFWMCENLTDVTIPDSVVWMGYGVFDDCSSLTNVKLSNSITAINGATFSGCSKLDSITIPQGVTTIGYEAFNGCTSLAEFTMPSSIELVGTNAFNGCYNLKTVYGAGSMADWCNINFYDGYNTNPLVYADKLYINGQLITDLVIPNDVSAINQGTFYGYKGLTSLQFGSSVTSIGRQAFYYCTNMATVNYTGSISDWCNIKFDYYESNPAYFVGGLCINGESLTDLVIPDDVAAIGDYAFCGFESLQSVKIGNNVLSIGVGAFSDCINITSVVIPDSVKVIGVFAFNNCEKLSNVDIGNGVEIIDCAAFQSCKALSSVTLGSNLREIHEYAFAVCESLTSIVIPANVVKIESDAFARASLKTIYWNATACKDIGVVFLSGTDYYGNAFSSCYDWTAVVIGENVTVIPQRWLNAVTSITFNGTVAQWEQIEKGEYWYGYNSELTIVCSDGEVLFQTTELPF